MRARLLLAVGLVVALAGCSSEREQVRLPVVPASVAVVAVPAWWLSDDGALRRRRYAHAERSVPVFVYVGTRGAGRANYHRHGVGHRGRRHHW